MDISEEIDESGFALRSVDEVDLSWVEDFVNFDVFLMLEYVLKSFGSDEFFEFSVLSREFS